MMEVFKDGLDGDEAKIVEIRNNWKHKFSVDVEDKVKRFVFDRRDELPAYATIK